MLTLITEVFPKLLTPKNMIRSMPKKSPFRLPSKNKMVKAPKHCPNLKDSPFTILFDHWEVNCATNSLY